MKCFRTGCKKDVTDANTVSVTVNGEELKFCSNECRDEQLWHLLRTGKLTGFVDRMQAFVRKNFKTISILADGVMTEEERDSIGNGRILTRTFLDCITSTVYNTQLFETFCNDRDFTFSMGTPAEFLETIMEYNSEYKYHKGFVLFFH